MEQLSEINESSNINFNCSAGEEIMDMSGGHQEDNLPTNVETAATNEDDVGEHGSTSPQEQADADQQVRTLFISGLPLDTKPRELYLLFRTFKGYESSLLKTGPKFGKPTTPVGFVTFESREAADRARIELQGVKLDPNHSNPLRLDFAKSNTRKVTKVSRQLFSSPIPVPNVRPPPFNNSSYSMREYNTSHYYPANFIHTNQWHNLQTPNNQMICPFAFNITYQSGLVSNPYAAYQSLPSVPLPFHHAIMANSSTPASNPPPQIGSFCTPPNRESSSLNMQNPHQQQQRQPMMQQNQNYALPLSLDQTQSELDNTSDSGIIASYANLDLSLPTELNNRGDDGGGGGNISIDSKTAPVNKVNLNDMVNLSSDLPSVTDSGPSATLFVCNLGRYTSEEELKDVFSSIPGFVHLRMYSKGTDSTVAFVDFTDVESASFASEKLQGAVLQSSDNAGIRIEFVKNKLKQIQQNILENKSQVNARQ